MVPDESGSDQPTSAALRASDNHVVPPPRSTSLEPPSLEKIVQDLHAPIYRYLYRMAGTVADAEDLTQQTFLLVQRNLGQLREIDRLRHWVFRIARNQYLQSRRKRVPLPASTAELVVDQLPAENDDYSPIDSEHLQKVLNELSDEHRLILMMYYFEELPYREIAEQLQIPIGTVMSRLARAKENLRARLQQSAAPQPGDRGSESLARARGNSNCPNSLGISHG